MQIPAKEKLNPKDDKDLLAFVFARFIEGELTGLLEGKAILHAPSLHEADFLAGQIRDEIKHARMYQALYRSLGMGDTPPRASWVLTKIMSPVSGRMWAEHSFLDKAVGEKWVYSMMQFLIQAVDDSRIVKALKLIAKDEEGHIAFGEEQTKAYIAVSRWRRYYLWGLYLRVDWAMALAHRLLRYRFKKKGSIKAVKLLDSYFSDARPRNRAHTASLLGVPEKRSLWQLVVCQAVFTWRSFWSWIL